jgi:hypothetical protein
MATTKLPLGYEAAVRVLSYAVEHRVSIAQAASQLGQDAGVVASCVRDMREYYMDGFIDKVELAAFLALRDQAQGTQVRAKATEQASAKQARQSGRVEAESAEAAAEEAEFQEARVYTELERDAEGLIFEYFFAIKVRDKPTLTGRLSRSEMELIYTQYPHVTTNQLANSFPAYNSGEMRKILRAFNITKDRKFPPHIIEEKSEEQIAEFALNAKERVSYKKLDLNRAGFIEKELRKSQEEVYQLEEERTLVDRLAGAVLDKYITQGRLAPAPPIPAYRPAFGDERPVGEPVAAFYGDTHFGKQFATSRVRGKGRGTNAAILTERLLCFAEECVEKLRQKSSTELHLFNMGDIFESLLPDGMHFQHAQEMELEGEQQLDAAIEAHEQMLDYIAQHAPHGPQLKITLHGLGGNHDRLGKSRDEDKRRTGALIFYAMLDRIMRYKLPGKVKVIPYVEGYFSVTVGRLNIIGFHGDSGLAKVKTPELLNTYRSGDSSHFTVVVSAHLHHNVTDEGHNYLRMTIGSICSTDDYAQNNLAKGSQPSGIFVEAARGYGVDLHKKTLY